MLGVALWLLCFLSEAGHVFAEEASSAPSTASRSALASSSWFNFDFDLKHPAFLAEAGLEQTATTPVSDSRRIGDADVDAAAPRRVQESSTETKARTLHMPDAGRRFQLGELWDERTGQPVSGRLWPERVLVANTYRTNASGTWYDFAIDDSFRSKMRLMDISADYAIKQNYVVGSMSLSTSGHYLTNKRRTAKAVRVATSYKTRTQKHKLDVYADSMQSKMYTKLIDVREQDCDECRKATHVVTQVTYGADVYAIYENTFTDEYDRTKLYAYMKYKLSMPLSSKEARAEALIENSDAVRYNTTRVNIYGDLNFDSPLPTALDEAIEFMKQIPHRTNTLVGQGVAMEVTLTPLVWLYPDAPKVVQEINAATLERLVSIYEDFDESEALIEDLVDTDYGGYGVWKASADALKNDFALFRSNFTTVLFFTLQQLQSGFLDQAAMAQLEKDYLQSAFTKAKVAAEVEQRLDNIKNLLALASTFAEAGITFATSVSDFFAPTFDPRFTRVYGLVLVGLDPSFDRQGLSYVRDFVSLARERRIREAQSDYADVLHCVERKEVGENTTSKCTEYIKFVAVHFDTHCQSFCSPEFCQADPTGNHTCPATGDKAPCELSHSVAERLRCNINDFMGQCGIDEEHSIDNYVKNPISDCWCACPRTQLLEYFQSLPAEGIKDSIPRAPERPVVVGVTEHDVPDPLPDQQLMLIEVNQSTDDRALFYRLTVLWHEFYQVGSTTGFEVRQRVEDTQGTRPLIPVRGLVAGVRYWFELQGVSDDGISRPTQVPGKFMAAYRMATLDFPTASNYDHERNIGPSWLDSRVQVTLSTRAGDQLGKIALHNEFTDSSGIDADRYKVNDESRLLVGEQCSEVTGVATSSALECTLHLASLPLQAGEGTFAPRLTMQLRVYDVTNFLVALAEVHFMRPSAQWCQRYGDDRFYCPDSNSCVPSCAACSPEANAVGNTCQKTVCPENQIYCPPDAHSSGHGCINRTHNPASVCRDWCKDEGGNGTVYTQIEDGPESCMASCNVSLGPEYNGGLVLRGQQLLIDCREPYHRVKGAPVLFTCPNEPSNQIDFEYNYDWHLVRSHSNYSALPVCDLCPDDQIWDASSRKCRYIRAAAGAGNYLVNGDFELDLLYFNVKNNSIEIVTPGMEGLGHAARINASVDAMAPCLTQYIDLQQRYTRKDDDGSIDVPPAGSIWQAALQFRSADGHMLNITGASPQLCLRDGKDPAESPGVCVDLPLGAASWQRAEVQLVVSDNPELLALDVWAGDSSIDVDHLSVVPIDGFQEPQRSPKDAQEELFQEIMRRLDTSIQRVDSDMDSLEQRLADSLHMQEENMHDVEAKLATKANKGMCKVCLQRKEKWNRPDGRRCNEGVVCSRFVPTWGTDNPSPTEADWQRRIAKDFIDDNSNNFHSCDVRTFIHCDPWDPTDPEYMLGPQE